VPLRRRRRLLLGLVIPLLLALTAYVVLKYERPVYAIMWPGLANGTTVKVYGLGTTSWGYYMGFGKMTLDVSTNDWVYVYVKPLNYYTFASRFNLSGLGTLIDTGYGMYFPCGRYGLIVHNDVVIPVKVSTYVDLYVYVPTDAEDVPLACYSQWSSALDSKTILTFGNAPHSLIYGSVYAKAYTYDPASGLVPTLFKLYDIADAWYWYPYLPYGSYGKTYIDGVWYLQMVAVYITDIDADVVLTATAVE